MTIRSLDLYTLARAIAHQPLDGYLDQTAEPCRSMAAHLGGIEGKAR